MEILGFGSTVIIDTAGIDDKGTLGELRISKTMQQLDIIDIAIILLSESVFGAEEVELISQLTLRQTPYILVHNKSDKYIVSNELVQHIDKTFGKKVISISAAESINLNELINELISVKNNFIENKPTLFGGLIDKGDYVLLVTPIDSEAPDGRMILPQVNAIRDVLDHNGINIVLRESELQKFFSDNKIKPKIVVTDSQAFEFVSRIVPDDIYLTGFSILLARLKGDFEEYLKGTPKISELKSGDKILLLESCTHTSSCEDIGRFKIPNWMMKFTGKELFFDIVSGLDKVQTPIEEYALIIQCGACMITRKQIFNRLRPAKDNNIPITNYGMAIAYMNGIFERATLPFLSNISKF
ncbi:[FeFe] hydrogenase H-cluster maturation GTPase HydF [Candidatus Kapaibacterium sp.]